MIEKILDIAFSGFWQFVGMIIILGGIISVLINLWTRFMRMLMVRKHGWPPEHLDVDGDWKEYFKKKKYE